MSDSKLKIELSPEQREVVDSWGVGLAISAGAGAGKTSTLVQKCLKLIERDPTARFAAVSFTEKSASDLREKLSREIDLERHWVTTIHGLCGSVLRDYPREAGFQGEERILDQIESAMLWERALESLWFDDIPDDVQASLERALARERRDDLLYLLARVKDLEIQGVMKHLERNTDPFAKDVTILAQFVIERYTRSKLRQGALDFSDLERGADRALRHPHVRKSYYDRFNLVLIDEFQDTNPLQADILLRFVKPDHSNLCIVGDPKQSIYRFRDADVETFERLCDLLPKRASLTWNFRSQAPLIEWINLVCQPTFQSSDLRFEPLVPRRPPNPEWNDPVVWARNATPERLGTFLKEELRAHPGAEIALLMRKIRGKEEWLKGLAQCGVPLAIGSGGLFWEDPRTRELVAFLKWWYGPKNTLSGGIFLRAPWMQINDQVLDEWVREDPTWVKPFFASNHPIARALLPHRTRATRPSELLLALLIDDKREEELYAPLLGLWHRAESLSERGMDASQVVRELARAAKEKRRERDVPPPDHFSGESQRQVRVLTLHASKGLEFDRVVLLDFSEVPSRPPRSPLLFWDKDEGVGLVQRDEEGKRDREAEEVFRKREYGKALQESKRLFYVALTRAREQLLLISEEREIKEPKALKPGQPVERKDPFLIDHWFGWVKESGVSLREIDLKAVEVFANEESLATGEGVPRAQVAARPRVRHEPPIWIQSRKSVSEWLKLAKCQRSYTWTVYGPNPPPAADGPAGPEFSFGAEPSELWPAGDEDLVFSSFDHPEGFVPEDFDPPPPKPAVVGEEGEAKRLGQDVHALFELWFENREEAGTEFARLKSAHKNLPWAQIKKYLDDPIAGEVLTELPFELESDGQLLVGVMDRVERFERNGVSHARLVDYKVISKPHIGEQEIKTLEARYRLQLELYAWALGRLDPELQQPGRMEASLVAIGNEDMCEIPVALPMYSELVSRMSQLVKSASVVDQTRVAVPTPNSDCKFCPFLSQCPEGRASM